MTARTQGAHLINADQQIVASVQVPAFPDNPGIVETKGRYFTNPEVTYGLDYLTYTETDVFHAECPAASV